MGRGISIGTRKELLKALESRYLNSSKKDRTRIDTAFVNDRLLEFCNTHNLEFTRCRSYHKNDQAWVEQKNGSIVRRLVGHQRFSGFVAAQTLAHLYQYARLYVNYFQTDGKEQGAKYRKA